MRGASYCNFLEKNLNNDEIQNFGINNVNIFERRNMISFMMGWRLGNLHVSVSH